MSSLLDSFHCRTTLAVQGRTYRIASLTALSKATGKDLHRLPRSLRILLEGLLRQENGVNIRREHVEALLAWDPRARSSVAEIPFVPARVLLQDLTGVPCLVDLAAMRDATAEHGLDPHRINPVIPIDLVIDHSVQVDASLDRGAFAENVRREYERNGERYAFLRWSAQAFQGVRVVPPGTGICHQVNLESLSQVVCRQEGAGGVEAFADTLVGADSHTPMVNGLGVLGWGVGGIEAEAAMLGQPMGLVLPRVVGVRITGTLRPGVTATDLVLTLTERLRAVGVVGAFVEFFGQGLASLAVADRATLANMAPEYGATVGYFPVDEQTLSYLRFTGRTADHVALVNAHMREQGLFATKGSPEPEFSEVVDLDLGEVETSVAGPLRPQDRLPLGRVSASFQRALEGGRGGSGTATATAVETRLGTVADGAVVIAAITSCTNTSNPSVMVAAGLLARKARAAGLERKPWVKTSLAPGSRVVTRYLEELGLLKDLEAAGFALVGYGCTTCIGNSGPLLPEVAGAVAEGNLMVAAVLSGNRNFEGRINPQVRMSYLASPPLVVAYALAGTVDLDLEREPLGEDAQGRPVFLADIWPSREEIEEAMRRGIRPEQFSQEYARVFEGDEAWRALPVPSGDLYRWDEKSTYIRRPSFLERVPGDPPPRGDVKGARILALLGDFVTTDHISPAGAIAPQSPAGIWLREQGVLPRDFNSYGSRRGNHEVLTRGTFGNVRLRNQLAGGKEGGFTALQPEGDVLPLYDVAMRYRERGETCMVVAGQGYGMGSSRDWAAKGALLLGVVATLAVSYERIHRSNLLGMGVLPLEFPPGESAKTWGLDGTERIDVEGLGGDLAPRQDLVLRVRRQSDRSPTTHRVRSRLDTSDEVDMWRHGGILPWVLRRLWAQPSDCQPTDGSS